MVTTDAQIGSGSSALARLDNSLDTHLHRHLSGKHLSNIVPAVREDAHAVHASKSSSDGTPDRDIHASDNRCLGGVEPGIEEFEDDGEGSDAADGEAEEVAAEVDWQGLVA